MEQNTKIEAYLNSKRNSWAPTTKRSEGFRLKALLPILEQVNYNPEAFYEELKNQRYGIYTIRTIFNRINDFMAFNGNFEFINFFKNNRNLFKNSYQHKFVSYSFEEAREQIKKIPHIEVRKIANLMLSTGMRIHEALKYDGSGYVVGKGAKPRPVFSSEKVNNTVSEATVRYYCKQVGINPHALRKLAATKLAASGLSEADLMYTMGWSDIKTASKYLQPMKQDELAKKVKEVLQCNT